MTDDPPFSPIPPVFLSPGDVSNPEFGIVCRQVPAPVDRAAHRALQLIERLGLG